MFRFNTCIHYNQDKSCGIHAAPPVALPMACNSCKSYEGPMQDIDEKYVRNDMDLTLKRLVILENTAQSKPPKPPTFQPPESVGERKSFLSKVVSYVKAEASLLLKSLKPGQYEKRIAKCSSCPSLFPSPVPGQLGWCKSCGCGQKARAELTVKAKMPEATCPLKKW